MSTADAAASLPVLEDSSLLAASPVQDSSLRLLAAGGMAYRREDDQMELGHERLDEHALRYFGRVTCAETPGVAYAGLCMQRARRRGGAWWVGMRWEGLSYPHLLDGAHGAARHVAGVKA